MKRRSHPLLSILKQPGLKHISNRVRGFTLIEVLVVIILIGIIFAIASPGWDALLSRQRVNAAREQVLQTIRQTQSKARTTRTPQVVLFDQNPNGMPRVGTRSLSGAAALPIDPATINDWKFLSSSGEITNQQQKLIVLRSNSPAISNQYYQLVFDSTGAVAQNSTVAAVTTDQFSALPNGAPNGFAVTLSRPNATGNGTYRCVIVNTLLGATRLAERGDCP